MRFLLEVLGALAIFFAIKRWSDNRYAPSAPGGGAGPELGRRRRAPGEVSAPASHPKMMEMLSPQQLAELSPRERAFVLEVLRGLEVRGGNAEGVTTSRIPGALPGETAAGRAARGATPRASPPLAPPAPPDAVLPVRLYCPACGAPLGEAGRRLADVTECHGCGRALAVRPEAERLVVTMALDADARGPRAD